MEAARGLPAGESSQPMGELHHMECWETGSEAVPVPQASHSEEGEIPPVRRQISAEFCLPLYSSN